MRGRVNICVEVLRQAHLTRRVAKFLKSRSCLGMDYRPFSQFVSWCVAAYHMAEIKDGGKAGTLSRGGMPLCE